MGKTTEELEFAVNKNIASVSAEKGIGYFDLTEDVETTEFIGHVINQLDEFINISNSEHPLYKQFMLKVKKLELSNDEIDYLENEITRSINESVTPGFKLLSVTCRPKITSG